MYSLMLGFFILFFSQLSPAQDFFADLAAPITTPQTSLRFSSSDEPEIKGDRDQSHIDQQKFSLSTPINSVPTDPALISWKWSQMNISDGLILPNGHRIPTHLYDSEYGLSYKHSDSENEFAGASVSFGSASDRTFTSKDNSTLSANIFYSQSTNPTARWIWLMNYSNNRSFANGVPLPGFAYVYRPSKEFFGVFGFPFAFMRLQMNEKWNAVLFLGPYVYKLELARSLIGPYQAYFQLDSTLQNYYLDNREQKENRLFIAESKSLLGIKGPISKLLYLDLFTGLAFNRSISENQNYKIDKQDHLLLENRYFLGLQISAKF